jgi:branched-chain amino acid transport system substrate-binding protein
LRFILSLLASVALASPALADIQRGRRRAHGGQNGVFGKQMQVGVTAAITAINAAGGINGEPLRAIVEDDGCDTRRAFDVAQNLARQDVRVVIGHFCSGAMIAASKTYLEAGILAITPAATLPAVTDQQGWNVLRLASRDDAQADIAAQRMLAEDAAARVAIISDGQPVMRSSWTASRASFPPERAGGETRHHGIHRCCERGEGVGQHGCLSCLVGL